MGQGFGAISAGRAPGHASGMTVTDPDTPDPLNDPRTLQADPGALGQGEDLASTEDDPIAAGEDELATGQTALTGVTATVTGGMASEP